MGGMKEGDQVVLCFPAAVKQVIGKHIQVSAIDGRDWTMVVPADYVSIILNNEEPSDGGVEHP